MGAGALAGGAANALMFFALFVGLILASLVVFSYASYSFLVTFVNTAAGNDEIMWPGDPIQDWFFKLWYFLWLLALWAVPASLLLGLLRLSGLVSTGLIVGLVWLMFPVSFLSSMSGSSYFMVLRPVILGRLLLRPVQVIAFYFITGLLLAACGIVFYKGLTRTVLLLPVAAVAGAACFLIYARLLGRIAQLIESMTAAPAEARPSEQTPKKKRPGTKPPGRAYDPWAVPPAVRRPTHPKPRRQEERVPDDPYGPAEGTYELAVGEPQAITTPPEKTDWLDIDPVPYAVSSAEAKKAPLPEPIEVTKREEELAAPRRPPEPSDWLLVTGVYTFPFYGTSLGPLGTLALGFFLIGGLLRLLVSFFPS